MLVECEHMNPGGSVKDRIALAIIDDAERRGVLLPGMTLVEATAGNTGVGLALVAAVRGYPLVCVMPEKMSVDKRVSLRAMGAKVVLAQNVPTSNPANFQNVARRLAEENGWFLTDQFNNPANVAAHEQTGREILQQVGGPIGAFVSGVGTGGTIRGVGRVLKRSDARTVVTLADPVGSGLASWLETGTLGPSSDYAVEGIGSSAVPGNLDREVVDTAERVSDAESFAMVERLVREEGPKRGCTVASGRAWPPTENSRSSPCVRRMTALRISAPRCPAWPPICEQRQIALVLETGLENPLSTTYKCQRGEGAMTIYMNGEPVVQAPLGNEESARECLAAADVLSGHLEPGPHGLRRRRPQHRPANDLADRRRLRRGTCLAVAGRLTLVWA